MLRCLVIFLEASRREEAHGPLAARVALSQGLCPSGSE